MPHRNTRTWSRAVTAIMAARMAALVFCLLATCGLWAPTAVRAQENGVITSRTYFGAPPLQRTPEMQARQRALLAASSRYQKPYKICTSEWAPMVRCSAQDDPTTYTGYQVELFRLVATELGWKEGRDWYFSCEDWTPMLEDLLSANGTCTMSAAAVEVSLENLVSGIKFSWPIYKSGFKVLIASAVQMGGTWAFASAFHSSVWLVLGGTATFVALMISLSEFITHRHRANKKGLVGWTWFSFAKMVGIPVHIGDPQTWGSRILVLSYGFLVLIIVHLYTATSAARLTQLRMENDITSKSDLPGKTVETWEPYVGLLRKYSIDAVGLEWENDDDSAAFLANLRAGKYKALVLDAPVIDMWVAENTNCDLFAVGDSFETFNLAIAFPPDYDDAGISAMSQVIVKLQTEENQLDKLDAQFITRSRDAVRCPARNNQNASTQITLAQVLGLWYILSIGAGTALLMTGAQKGWGWLKEREAVAAAARMPLAREASRILMTQNSTVQRFLGTHASADADDPHGHDGHGQRSMSRLASLRASFRMPHFGGTRRSTEVPHSAGGARRSMEGLHSPAAAGSPRKPPRLAGQDGAEAKPKAPWDKEEEQPAHRVVFQVAAFEEEEPAPPANGGGNAPHTAADGGQGQQQGAHPRSS